MFKEFKKFAIKGNAVDMAVGIIIGAAFSTIVNSLVNDMIMPLVGAAFGNIDFTNLFIVLRQGAEVAGPYLSLAEAKAAGAVTFNYGIFINAVVSFLLVAWALFFVIRGMNKIRPDEEKLITTKKCEFCKSEISLEATKCPHCTADLNSN